MKIREFFSRNKKKVTLLLMALVILLCAVIGGLLLFAYKKADSPLSLLQGGNMGGFHVNADVVGASGVTSIGMTQENFQVENLETELFIEEVYISSNEEIAQGTKILKVSEESLEKARKELTETLQKAALAYRAGTIEYEQSKITAKYERDMAVLQGEQAKEIYDETILGLESSVERAQEELTEAMEELAKQQAEASGNTYYEDYKVGEYKELYDENLELLKARMEEWGVGWSQVISGSSGMGGFDASIPVSGNNAADGHVSILSSLYKVLEQNLSDYEQALSEYEYAVANAGFELQTLELSLSSLRKSLAEAQSSYETRLLEAKLDYETSLANAQRADSDYETALQKAESDYETLKDTKEDAEKNLELFENSIGDGYYYALGKGTVMRSMVRTGQYLTSESTIFIYSNPEEISVTVSVDQSDIAAIAVGDSGYVESGAYGSFEGIVTQINPVSESGSRTGVTYNVTVTLQDASALPANQSVTVIFGVGGRANE